DQLRRLEELDVFHVNWLDHLELAKSEARAAREVLGAVLRQPFDEIAHLRPGLAAPVRRTADQVWRSLPGLPEGFNPVERLEARARSYLHANCAQCHVEAGGGNAQIELEITTPREKMRLIGVKPLHDSFGIKDAKLIVPGDPEKSILYQRLKRRGPGQMPPLATAVVDEEAAQVIHDWIKAMKPDAGKTNRTE